MRAPVAEWSVRGASRGALEAAGERLRARPGQIARAVLPRPASRDDLGHRRAREVWKFNEAVNETEPGVASASRREHAGFNHRSPQIEPSL